MGYVYRHIRLDTLKPFYIGIGTSDGGRYARAHTDQCRNRYWHNIVKKAGYTVEIMMDGLSWDETREKEIEFIKLYGRKQFGGLLINLTDGGEGSVGYVTSDESKAKQRLRKIGKPPPNKGKPMPVHQLENLIKINKGRPSWNKGLKYSEERCKKMSEERMGVKRGKRATSLSVKARYNISKSRAGGKFNESVISALPANKNKLSQVKKVNQYDIQGNFIQEHHSMALAAQWAGVNKTTISKACKKDGFVSRGYLWKFKTESHKEIPLKDNNLGICLSL